MNKSQAKTLLKTLYRQLNILKEREAKFASNAPLELLNQIEDHQKAIGLVESRLAGEISDKALAEQLAPLALSLDRGGTEIVSGKNIIKIGTLVIPTVPLLALLGVVVALLVFLGLNFIGPAKMPLNTFNIAVAEFGQIDAQGHVASSADGRSLSEWMFRAMQSEYKNWPTRQPAVWHDSMSIFEKRVKIGLITGDTPAERNKAAQAVAERIGANMVIYGNIATDEQPPRFTPEFYIAKIRNEADELVGNQELGTPIEVKLPLNLYDEQVNAFFEGNLGSRIDALVWFTRGLALDLSGRHEDALAVFKQAEAEPQLKDWQDGREILYYFIGREALFVGLDKPGFLDEAEVAFKRALEIKADYVRAHIGLGGVYFQRAQQLPPEQRLQTDDLNLAIAEYKLVYENSPDSSNDQVKIKGLLSLGKAYRLQGEAYLHAGQNDRAEPVYTLAIDKITAATKLLDPDQHRLLAQAYLGLGAAYEGKAYIRSAGGDKAASKPLYQEAQTAYSQCVKEADAEVYDASLQEIKTKYCVPYSEAVQKVLNDL